MEKMKRLAKEENGNQNFIKSGTLEPKEAFGMKSLGDLKLFEQNEIWKVAHKMEFERIISKIREEKMRCDAWLLGSMPKSDHDNYPSYE